MLSGWLENYEPATLPTIITKNKHKNTIIINSFEFLPVIGMVNGVDVGLGVYVVVGVIVGVIVGELVGIDV